jgi:translation initiation factor 4E
VRSLHTNIKAPSQLQPSSTCALFKDGIEPQWEDPANASGGCWTAVVPRVANANELLDSWWLQMVRVCV